MSFNPEDIEHPFQLAKFSYADTVMEAPAIVLPTAGGNIVCHWGNTLVRCFMFQPEIDHVEYYDERQTPNGIYVERALLDAFIAHAYPVRKDPYVDSATRDWYIDMQMKSLDIDLGDI